MICFDVFVLDTSSNQMKLRGILNNISLIVMLPSLFTHETKLFVHDYYVERICLQM